MGRDPEVGAARAVIERARAGSGQVALIVGEAGVGKSRRLRAMFDEARAHGFLLMRGQSFEADSSIPYAPLLDLVRLFAESASPALVTHVLEPAAAELTAFFPELRPLLPEVVPAAASAPDADKRRRFHARAHPHRCARWPHSTTARARRCAASWWRCGRITTGRPTVRRGSSRSISR